MFYYHFNANLVPQNQQILLEKMFTCKNFKKSDRLLGFAKGRGITWFLNTQAELGVNSVLRHYRRGGLFGKVIKDSYLFRGIEHTRAFQEFSLLEKMCAWRLPVPRPIAIQIEKRFCCYRADIIIEKVENTRDLSQIKFTILILIFIIFCKIQAVNFGLLISISVIFSQVMVGSKVI